jgi:ATP-dependent RNA helicase RhlE
VSFNQFNLDPRLMVGINRSGYEIPTPIQLAAIPAALEGNDLIGTAQTGTGKTAAFVLPILHRLLNGPRRVARSLIVTPTRELAEQINDTIHELAHGTQIRSATIYGGVGPAPQVRALREGVEILVACPGRLLDLMAQGHARLGGIEILVLDEADRMFDMGFLPDVKKIIRAVPPRRQTLLFSATFPKEIEELASMSLHEPKRISLGISRPAQTVRHALYPVPQHLKTGLLLALLRKTDTDSVLIFTRTKHRAERLSNQIAHAGFRVTSLHSNRSQNQRQAALGGFKTGHFQIMVATDIAARGLDVESISHVINFDMPDTPDAYIHRIGRTGRAERSGDAFTLVTPEDTDMIRTLEKIMGAPLVRENLAEFDYTQPAPPKPATVVHPTHHSPGTRHVPANENHGSKSPNQHSPRKNTQAPRGRTR